MVVRVQLLRTRLQQEVNSFIARLPAYEKPQTKKIFAAYYTATPTITYFIEVKQKASEHFESVRDKDKIATFTTLLGAKYSIYKHNLGSHELAKAKKAEVIPSPTNASQIALHIESRTIYSIKAPAANDVSVTVVSYNDTFDIYAEGDKSEIDKLFSASSHSKSKSSSSPSSTSTMEWMLPNRAGFSKWMYSRFGPDKYVATKGDKLFPQQRLIRDFMQYHSPYRGILLFHGLGVGKTCASIAAAEGFLERHKKIHVLVPASLAKNYKNEILRCASIGNPQTKLWNLTSVPANKDHPEVKRIIEAYHIPYDTIKRYHDRLWLPYITDGVHFSRRGVAWEALSVADCDTISKFMMDYIDTKYNFISYNGITSKGVAALGANPFDDSFIVMDEAHNFVSRVVNGGKIASRLFNMILNSKRSKMIFLTGTPIINHPFELSVLLNLIRGPMKMFSYKGLAHPETVQTKLEAADLMKYVDFIRTNPDEDNTVDIQILPLDFVLKHDALKHEKWRTNETGIETRIRKAIGATKRPSIIEEFALPSTRDEFNKLFLDESDQQNPRVINSDLFMRRILGLVSYFRTAGEEYFPTMLPRIVQKTPLTGYQFSQYVEVRDKERRMEQNRGGLFEKKNSVYRAFSRMVCNFAFPEDIKRPFPGELRAQLRREISHDDEDPDDTEDDISKRAQKEYDKKLKAAMEHLQTSSDRPLQFVKLHNFYGPKFANMTQDILDSPGTCLLYSQFRTVEGLGVMRLVLKQAGFAEIEVERQGGSDWVITNADTVLAPEFDGKRYVVFNEDREKTDLLIKIFNGAFSELPQSLADQFKDKSNLYGNVVRVIMISQSGAEGISLKNVRRVMITEPFWNKVRIDQVIGRAVRAGSHLALPADERNVQVFTYMATFTPEQLARNFTLRQLDDSQTSDEHIHEIAEKKSKIIEQFLAMLKRASFDCATHAAPNKMLSGTGLQCYSFPINMDDKAFAFLPTLEDEKRELEKIKLEKTHRIRGRVVTKDGTRYVKVDDVPSAAGTLYDYRAYKDAGVLLPVATI